MPYGKILKFLISGTTVAGTDLVFLFVLVKLCGVPYVPASVIAFVIAVSLSFVLQKFWTFQDYSTDILQKQVMQYVGTACMNLLGNTLGIYVLVDIFSAHYLVAQFALMLFFACTNYLLYLSIFAKRNKESV